MEIRYSTKEDTPSFNEYNSVKENVGLHNGDMNIYAKLYPLIKY